MYNVSITYLFLKYVVFVTNWQRVHNMIKTVGVKAFIIVYNTCMSYTRITYIYVRVCTCACNIRV